MVELQGTDSCEGVANAAPLFDITAPQPAVVQLDSAGSRTFACGLPSHCSDGMRLTVNVREPGTAAETPQEGQLSGLLCSDVVARLAPDDARLLCRPGARPEARTQAWGGPLR